MDTVYGKGMGEHNRNPSDEDTSMVGNASPPLKRKRTGGYNATINVSTDDLGSGRKLFTIIPSGHLSLSFAGRFLVRGL